MPNIHIVQCDDPKYLPFARSRLKQIRANGLAYASQRFEVDGATIHVRKEGEQEFIKISGGAGGAIWVLLMLEKTVSGTDIMPPGFGGGGSSTPRVTTRKTKIVRIAKFGHYDQTVEAVTPATKAKIVASFTDTATYTPTVSSYSAPDISHAEPAEFITLYYLSNATITGNMKKSPSAVSVYGGVPTYYSSYLASGERTESRSATGVVVIKDQSPPPGAYSATWHTTFTVHSTTTDRTYTRVTYKGVVRDHDFVYTSTHDAFTASPGPDTSSSSTSKTGEVAYEGASLPSPLYSYSTAVPGSENLGDTPYVYDLDVKNFVVSEGPFVGFTNPVSHYTTAWTWASGPATVNTAPGDPEWDPLVGAVPRKRRPHEVGWYKQGHDFIQWGAGTSDPTWVYNRYCAPASLKTFVGGPRAYALDYNHCVHIGGVNGYPVSWANTWKPHILTLIRQTGTGDAYLANLTILGAVDLAAIKGIGADFIQAFSLTQLPISGNPTLDHGTYDNTRNSIVMNYSTGPDTYNTLKIQIAIDQKALFDPLTDWTKEQK